MPHTTEKIQRTVNRNSEKDTRSDTETRKEMKHTATNDDPNRENTDTKLTEKENTELHRDERNQNMQVIKKEDDNDKRDRPGTLDDDDEEK